MLKPPRPPAPPCGGCAPCAGGVPCGFCGAVCCACESMRTAAKTGSVFMAILFTRSLEGRRRSSKDLSSLRPSKPSKTEGSFEISFDSLRTLRYLRVQRETARPITQAQQPIAALAQFRDAEHWLPNAQALTPAARLPVGSQCETQNQAVRRAYQGKNPCKVA